MATAWDNIEKLVSEAPPRNRVILRDLKPECAVDPGGEHQRHRYDQNVSMRERRQDSFWIRRAHVTATTPRLDWMDDPSLLPKRPPGVK